MVRARLAVVMLAIASSVASAKVQLGSLFGDHMVIQRGIEAPIFGTATPSARVSVTLDGKEVARGEADTDGSFNVKLPRLDAPGPYTITVSDGDETKTLSDVLAGDVWLCSGQSNMEFAVSRANDAASEIAAANYPQIRIVTVKRNAKENPVKHVNVSWAATTPETVSSFSAVGYYFGRALQKELNVPIGLIHSSWGGTPAEAWTPLPVLEKLTDLKAVQSQLARREKFLDDQIRSTTRPATAQATTSTMPATTRAAVGQGQGITATLYNGMIAPIGPFAIKGAIWYQGESNAGRADEYQPLLTAMIGSWREQFQVGDFPFYIVGLANYKERTTEPNDPSGWARVREAQRQITHDVKNTGMSVTIDIGQAEDIHPTNKQDVGKRLALIALEETYGKTLVSRGPTLKNATFDGANVTIHFDHVGGGLKQQGDALDWFSLAGEDGVFAWADAKIVDDTVVLSSPKVPNPTVARYAWGQNPRASLFNAEKLPAEPFEVKK